MTAPIHTTVADVVAGRYDEHTVVTITGLAMAWQRKTTRQGNPWMQFDVKSPRTAVTVLLFPENLKRFDALLGPAVQADGAWRPPEVSITGRVAFSGIRPQVIVDELTRLSPESGPSLTWVLERSRRIFARPDVQAAFRAVFERPVP